MVAAAALVVAVGLVVALRDDDEPAATATTAGSGSRSGVKTEEPPVPYSLESTRRCLREAGIAVSRITSEDPRLRALGDLAQRTSLELHFKSEVIGLAFGDAPLLVSLLEVPDDPYRLEARRNAVLMYRPRASRAADVVRSCLRS